MPRFGNGPGSTTPVPSVSCTITSHLMASLETLIPPAGFIPTATPVSRSKSRIASSITSPTGRVAAGCTLPVEVLMKSAPAAIANIEARRTASRVPNSPVSRITLRWAGPQASLTAAISSNTRSWRPARKAPRSITMSTSWAPMATTRLVSSSLTSSGA